MTSSGTYGRPTPTIAGAGFVFLAGLVTALATGLGAIPCSFVDDASTRWNVALWGVAAGVSLADLGLEAGVASSGWRSPSSACS